MKQFCSVFALSLVLGSPALASAAAEKLLLKEVVVSPTQAEYVAIFNNGSTPINLSNYYLADSNTYFLATTSNAVGSSDFILRFPTGATIMPGETQYIAIAGAECFKSACGSTGTYQGFTVYPNYELNLGDPTKTSAQVPDMIVPYMGAVGTNPTLTNGGEPVVLFYWDGASELVTDVDYVFYGAATTSNPAVNKTGITVGTSTYQPDTADDPTRHALVSAGTITLNTCRVDMNEGMQLMTGSNGVAGRNETSEDWNNTWTPCQTVTPMPGGGMGTGGAGGGMGTGGAGGMMGTGGAGGMMGTGGAGGTAGTGGAGGTAGTGGAGGTAGTGGAGGMAGTGGAGGMAGTGGAGGAGGMAGTGGAGTTTTSGTTTGAGGSSSGEGGGGSANAGDDSGCGCSVVGEAEGSNEPPGAGLLALLGIAAVSGRRRARASGRRRARA